MAMFGRELFVAGVLTLLVMSMATASPTTVDVDRDVRALADITSKVFANMGHEESPSSQPAESSSGSVSPSMVELKAKAGDIAGLARKLVAYIDSKKKTGDAAKIMAETYRKATELVREAHPKAPPSEKLDQTVALSCYALNGPSVLGKLKYANSKNTKMLTYMHVIDKEAGHGANGGFAGMGLDPTNGKGTLDPKLDDNTNNQAYHTNFFICAGYIAGSVRQIIVTAGNVVHETVDPNAWMGSGASTQDFFASAMGQAAGVMLKELRRTTEIPDTDLYASAIVGSMVSKKGVKPLRVKGMTDQHYQVATKLASSIDHYRDDSINSKAIRYNPINIGVVAAQVMSKTIHKVSSFFSWVSNGVKNMLGWN